ncbi:MAG: SCO family protein [Bacteroidetes bacterium]|jgi:protein SCO1/2|nr:SCO family protein [Bacteroidota bacterium]
MAINRLPINYWLLTCAWVVASCSSHSTLPFYGIETIEGADTTFRELPDFSFLDQDGQPFTHETLKGKVYVADFFFVSCPTICPVMTKHLKEVYDKVGPEPNFLLVSHTIDPRHDTVEALRDYAERLGVSKDRWRFVWGHKDAVYHMGHSFYMASMQEDGSEGSGGYLHSGSFILVDAHGRIRGLYDGTQAREVPRLVADIHKLLR